MKNKGYEKFGEANKVHYGKCESGVKVLRKRDEIGEVRASRIFPLLLISAQFLMILQVHMN